jgi:hypothetical protein
MENNNINPLSSSSETEKKSGINWEELLVWLGFLIVTFVASVLIWLFSRGFGWGATQTEEMITYLIPVPGILFLFLLVRRIKKDNRKE